MNAELTDYNVMETYANYKYALFNKPEQPDLLPQVLVVEPPFVDEELSIDYNEKLSHFKQLPIQERCEIIMNSEQVYAIEHTLEGNIEQLVYHLRWATVMTNGEECIIPLPTTKEFMDSLKAVCQPTTQLLVFHLLDIFYRTSELRYAYPFLKSEFSQDNIKMDIYDTMMVLFKNLISNVAPGAALIDALWTWWMWETSYDGLSLDSDKFEKELLADPLNEAFIQDDEDEDEDYEDYDDEGYGSDENDIDDGYMSDI